MSGKTSSQWTALTPRRIYRYRVSEVDSAPGGELPVIRADLREGVSGVRPPATNGLLTGFGHNTVLVLSVGYLPPGGAVPGIHGLLPAESEIEHADIRVWLLAANEGRAYGNEGLTAVEGRWMLVHEQSVSCNTVIRLHDLPAGRYCVTVDSLAADPTTDSDDGTVTIFEQHSD